MLLSVRDIDEASRPENLRTGHRPTGENGVVRYAGVFTVSGGRITSQRVYLDRLDVLEATKALAAP